MLNQKLKDKFEFLLGKEWFDLLEPYFQSRDFDYLYTELFRERKSYTIYPDKDSDLLFKAFRTTPFSKVKIIVLGQDPYHDDSYDGFAFSNTERLRLSPSLQNIFKEVESDAYDGFKLVQDPELIRWAEQGVLLINTAHTVRKGEPASHLRLWTMFTARVLHVLAERRNPTVWMLWGAKAKGHLAGRTLPESHLKLTAPHPSPFSAHTGFYGCKHFTKANEFLLNNNIEPISW